MADARPPSGDDQKLAATRPTDPASGSGTEVGGPYPNYVLGVLVLVYVFNFLDRQILSILNERIKADLGVSDADMGFLYGTAFAVFYAVFGIPLGRLADVWNRRTLIAIGLSFWSVMTALSGLTRNFAQLAAVRIGVGIGEASASPAAFSLLSDYFPPARRATVLAIYSGGVYIGSGLGLMIGGGIVERWDLAYADGASPFGLRGWQVAFFVVGLPGLLLAAWVRSLREPVRGQADGIFAAPEPHPFREFGFELRAVIPPLTVPHLIQLGASRGVVAGNIGGAAAIGLLAAGLVWLTGDTYQWVALGIGLYSALSWVQALLLRDPPTAALVLGTPALRWACLGFSCLAFSGYSAGYWTAPFFVRFHEVDLAQIGLLVGGTGALGGWLGVTFGGLAADALRKRSVNGRIYVALATAVAPVPLAFMMLFAEDVRVAYALNLPLSIAAAMWLGAGASTVQDLVLPRMRASASAFYLLVITFIGLALGPYTVGQISDVTGDLRTGLLCAFVANGVAVACLLMALRHLGRDEASVLERARGAGES